LRSATSAASCTLATALTGVPSCCALRCELAWGGPARRS